MTFPKFLDRLFLILAGGIIGYFINTYIHEKTIALNTPKIEINERSKKVFTNTPPPKQTSTSPPQIIPKAIATSIKHLPKDQLCFADNDQLSLHLTLFAERLEKDSLWYNSKEPEKLLDCSGIFHQTSRFVRSKCEAYQYPNPKRTRDSRSLAKWYNEKENLIIIDDPMSKRNLIKPGAVMFFGKPKQVYQPTVEQVTAPYPSGIVGHIGVVTEVKKDEAGNVIGYTMFHGRHQGMTAQRSYYHGIDPPRLGYPILGNWNQQWIAIAYIMTPVL